MEKYIMAIDQGTTSSRAILFDHSGRIVNSAQKEFTQIFRKPGWVEHDANEIWLSVLSVMATCLQQAGIQPAQVAGIGITNQRETTVIWNKDTGLPICNAIVWQSRQTADICDKLKAEGYDDLFRKKTGLRIDPYFSGTKIRWMLDSVPGAQKLAEEGKLYAGTIDSWLIYCLSGMQAHVTDYSNASRTLLYNIYEKKWDPELCKILNIPMSMLPEVKESSGIFAYTAPYHFFGCAVPIAGVAGDQQAAMFGQGCFLQGSAKNTYGTGCFLLMNTGTVPHASNNGLLTTIAWGLHGEIYYALEGSVFVAGSAIQWLRDQMKFFPKASMSQEFAERADPDNGVFLVPAFTGLGAPYWDDRCRGALFGITRGTSREDITKATLDSLCYQTRDVLEAMEQDAGICIKHLKVDGGASANDYLMQFQSDLLQCRIIRPHDVETTALGAARLAGLALHYWTMNDFEQAGRNCVEYAPKADKQRMDGLYAKWKQAVASARMFSD
ncbi:MAG: glycerol kinase GlpK [Erysipelotrichaceae bacterium]|nr:glycerol kinase GlpK [Erysipelotrichaceae bacterium]